ncbi:MAG: MMPL family transporter [Pseudomonadota bacterium]
MGTYFKAIDRFAVRLTTGVIRWRWPVIVASIVIAGLFGSNTVNLTFTNNYRVFFSESNPELNAFLEFQDTYTKNDNVLFVVKPTDGNVFSAESLTAIEAITEAAWQIPFALRVDSITNFQHTYSIEDDLIVEDLASNIERREAAWFAERKAIAMEEPLLANLLVNDDASVTAINVVLQYPELTEEEVPATVAEARAIRDRLQADYPGMQIQLTGLSMLNNAFAETGVNDGMRLMPIMFIVIFVMSWLIVRSLAATFSTIMVIALSSTVAMGVAGIAGLGLTPISMSAPIVILTLAVADSIHILMSLRTLMREGMEKRDAIIEAVRINFLPVGITSLTTIVGFLALNFSDSPPFWHLGNLTAVGILAAWFYSITLLPALLSMLPFSVAQSSQTSWSQRAMSSLAEFVIARNKLLLLVMGTATLVLISFIPQNEFSDQWVEYFDESVEFRRDSDLAMQEFGIFPIEFSIPAREPGGVSEPEYLENLEKLANWFSEQEGVTHVYSIADIMKRLNKNMHGDDESYYRIPDDRELSAQYLLLYELSLPYGLDLNDRINIDKSATRITATLGKTSTARTREFLDEAELFIQENLPAYMHAKPTAAAVMFAYITERNLRNMFLGTVIAIFAIAVIMMFALRSFQLGALSLIPNGLPILATYGAWALLVGEVGFSVSVVASISLGIIVDDTVHFLSKYVRARDERALSVEDSIRYAFNNVGLAIVVNTIILSVGFLVLMQSVFKPNFDMGLMTVLAIIFALILDFLLLPALLLLGRKGPEPVVVDELATSNA